MRLIEMTIFTKIPIHLHEPQHDQQHFLTAEPYLHTRELHPRARTPSVCLDRSLCVRDNSYR